VTPTLLTEPVLVASLISTTGVVLRCALVEVRWWLALRDTAPADRAEIISALRAPRPPRVARSTRSARQP
jgi:hypothetical protein